MNTDYIEFISNNLVPIVTTGIALVALVVSIWSAYISRKNLITTAIASNRMEWIKTVRGLVVRFLDEYENKNEDKKELVKIYNHMLLYFNQSGRTYKNLVNSMKKCLQEEYRIENSWAVICAAQETLDGPWVRMKREAGISMREEMKITESVHQELYKAKVNQWNVEWTERNDET